MLFCSCVDFTSDRLLLNVLRTDWVSLGIRLEQIDLVSDFGDVHEKCSDAHSLASSSWDVVRSSSQLLFPPQGTGCALLSPYFANLHSPHAYIQFAVEAMVLTGSGLFLAKAISCSRSSQAQRRSSALVQTGPAAMVIVNERDTYRNSQFCSRRVVGSAKRASDRTVSVRIPCPTALCIARA